MKIQYINNQTKENDIIRLCNELKKYFESSNKSLEIAIKPAKRMKTVRQLRYYHLLINLIVSDTGQNKKGLIVSHKDGLGYYDDHMINGKLLRDYRSMSLATIEIAGEFVRSAQMLCDFLSIKYPNPNQYYRSIGAK